MTVTDVPVALDGHPMIDSLARPWPQPSPRSEEYLRSVLESGNWSGAGPFERRFEDGFAALSGAAHGVCVVNGTVSLQLALEALDIGVGDEVIVPGYTWQATAAAVLDVNAVPILVDIDPQTLCVDPAAVAAAVSPRTRAVIVVHLYDSVADLSAVKQIVATHGLALIEDCAHSHGSEWEGVGVGAHGQFGSFSFQTSKLLTAGEGGLLLTSDDALHNRILRLRDCGRPSPHGPSAPIQSGNYRMTEWQAAILLAQLEEFPERLAEQHSAVAFLDDALSTVDGLTYSRRDKRVTRRGAYGYVLHYGPEAFEGLPIGVFRAALSLELGLALRPPYRPLNRSELYQPRTKARHRLNEDYWTAVDPARFDLPACEAAYRSVFVLPHQALLNPPRRLSALVAAVERIRRHAGALASRAADRPTEFPE